MQQWVDKRILELDEFLNVSTNSQRLRSGQSSNSVPVFTLNNFEQDFLPRSFARTDIRDEVALSDLTPRRGGEDSAATCILGHAGVGRARAK